MLSVIIVNYNSHDKLSLCVQSLINCQLDLDIIIVDNASRDDSLKNVQTAFRSHQNIRFIENQENLGFAVACNQGGRDASGDYLLYLNPDCKINSHAITQLKECLVQNPEVGMTGGQLLNSDGTEQVGGRRLIPTPWRTFVRVFKLRWLSPLFPRLFSDFNLHLESLPDHPVEVEAISGACMLVPRKAYEDVGGLDEGYFLHCEDLDWCMSFQEKGWKIMFVPDAKISHFQGSCSRSRRIFVEWCKHRGMVRFYRKFFLHKYPVVLMWLIACAVWLRFSLLACYFSLRQFFRWFKVAGT